MDMIMIIQLGGKSKGLKNFLSNEDNHLICFAK